MIYKLALLPLITGGGAIIWSMWVDLKHCFKEWCDGMDRDGWDY